MTAQQEALLERLEQLQDRLGDLGAALEQLIAERGAPPAPGPVLRFVVPGQTVGVNATHAGGRAQFKTAEARAFNALIAGHGMRARRMAGWATLEADPVEVGLRVVFKNERFDTDGPVKSILDALQASNPAQNRMGAAIMRNDRQVRRLLVERAIDARHPRVEVAVARYGDLLGANEILLPAEARR